MARQPKTKVKAAPAPPPAPAKRTPKVKVDIKGMKTEDVVDHVTKTNRLANELMEAFETLARARNSEEQERALVPFPALAMRVQSALKSGWIRYHDI